MNGLRKKAEAILRDEGYVPSGVRDGLWLREWPRCAVFDLDEWMTRAAVTLAACVVASDGADGLAFWEGR